MTQTAPRLARTWPFLRAHAHRWVPERVWESDDAAVLRVPRSTDRVLVGEGPAPALARLLVDAGLLDGGPPEGVERLLLTRGTYAALPPGPAAALRVEATWDWLTTATAPEPVAAPGTVRVLSAPPSPESGQLRRVHDCLDAGYPERGARPEDPELTWWGLETASGVLAGVLAADPPLPDSGGGVRLSAVAVRPDHRRRGLARALTAAAIEWGLSRAALVHLGIWADNDAARRLYTGLGLTTAHRVENVVGGQA